jgi:putative transposase
MAGARRWVWNWALERRLQHYRDHHGILSVTALCRELTPLKRRPDTTWLQEADSQALQQAIRDLDQAFQSFFAKRARFPRFKRKKRDRLTFRIPQRVKVADGRVCIPKIGWVHMRQSRSIDGRITSATFTRDGVGRWDVSFATETEVPDAPLPPVDPATIIGIDQGLADFVVLSDGTRIAAPRYFRKAERRLRRAQRRFSRCRRGSRRQQRARQQIARLHQRIASQRRDFIHKTTTRLVRTYEGVCIQKLAISGLARTKLGKSVQDAALGELHRQLAYKSQWHHRHFVVIDRWFPSSKLCGQCGAFNDGLSLSAREWLCPCGATHDRDLDAARNIRVEGLRVLDVAAGHAETENARREVVRLPTGAGLDEARIPRL